MLEQSLRQHKYSDEEIQKIKAVMSDPEAYQYAMQTGNFVAAYQMVLDKEKPTVSVSLDSWFSSFVRDKPEDAEALSVGLTKFARYVQSSVSKGKGE